MNRVLGNRLNEIIKDIDVSEKTIIVLKGISLDSEKQNNIDIEKLVLNPIEYFFEITKSNRKYVAYEEYLLLQSFFESQYEEIYIINNNLYIEQYPFKLKISSGLMEGLINHYLETDNDEDEDLLIGDISKYTDIFAGVKKTENGIVVAYSDNNILHLKTTEISLFDYKSEFVQTNENTNKVIDLIEEADYINVVDLVLNDCKYINIKISNYIGDVSRLKSRISMLTYYWKETINISIVNAKNDNLEFNSRKEFTEILKKYWGYDKFRKLSVYDIEKIGKGEKEIKVISQENIISNLVDEVEKCDKIGEDFRDLFVTAPTGAGKSVMFQIPAMYLAQKYNLLTIVISPLIGLMNDQVKNLEIKNYKYAKTINSDISPILKQEIIEKVSNSEYHILYISPETLLSRSDVEQLIGTRTIGMIVVDEAHIVTTWGKQFRPDYWYLGDHIRKLRKKQLMEKGRSFVVATFTATAIYHGIEDMYTETINSLHMLTPITYLGYVKRDDIEIVIQKKKKRIGERNEYEIDKFKDIEHMIEIAKVTGKKMLIYFPTVALIRRCYEYLIAVRKKDMVTTYYGSLSKDQKEQSYNEFYNGKKKVMLATKAFGMGIDINDITYVVHFAPTGNVCDYVQEIGRAARRTDIEGKAFYNYDTKDFKHINKLHGLSSIQRYQLIEVIKKIVELYQNNLKMKNKEFTRKRNAMLLDAENFAYIFGNPINEDDINANINKVKTALLIIQKDFESKIGFSPINVRPIPLFSTGFFKIEPATQTRINRKYSDTVVEIDVKQHICRVKLDNIWRKDYGNNSFPQFKYMIYSKDNDLAFNNSYTLIPALCVSVSYKDDYYNTFNSMWGNLKAFIKEKIISGEHTSIEDMVKVLGEKCNVNKYKATTICEVIIASMDSYRKNFAKSTSPIVQEKATVKGKIKYQFNVAVNSYIMWVERYFKNIINQTENGKIFLINNNGNTTKEYCTILGILESMDVLSFEMLGGANSQLYIYINQIQSLTNIINNPGKYENRLLSMVGNRHLISVKMLTYLYEGDFTSDERWNIIEDYFLGKIPESVKKQCLKEDSNIKFE